MTEALRNARRVVVKVGSSLVTDEGRGLDHAAVARWAAEIAELTRRGKEIVLVSSGAIAEGMQRLGWAVRPKAIHELQAAAAVGQMGEPQPHGQGGQQRRQRIEREPQRQLLTLPVQSGGQHPDHDAFRRG